MKEEYVLRKIWDKFFMKRHPDFILDKIVYNEFINVYHLYFVFKGNTIPVGNEKVQKLIVDTDQITKTTKKLNMLYCNKIENE